ncbi:hypothetical protein [Bacillus cereus group sp. BfR-BA-01538]|uniref:hypothetical protein n=1 Tax=Bacillus cereus group sp. BfR-BA-01538 TaxID=2920373 RepID=UPI001F58A4C9
MKKLKVITAIALSALTVTSSVGSIVKADEALPKSKYHGIKEISKFQNSITNTSISQKNLQTTKKKNNNKMQQETIHFVAYVVDSQNRMLKNQKVEIYDITELNPIKITEKTTSTEGKVEFNFADGLKFSRSYAVYINGESVGYTFRSNVKTEQKQTFQINHENGPDVGEQYNLPTESAQVRVVDENNIPLSGQKVAIYDGATKIFEGISNQEGIVEFDKDLKVGVFYHIYVNEHKINNFVRPGDTRTVAINDQEKV